MNHSAKVCWIFLAISIIMITPAQAVRQIHPQSITPVIGPPVTAPASVEKKSTFYRWKSSDVITEFKNHGLEVVDSKPGMVAGPPGARENILLLMPSFGNDVGILVSSFESVLQLNEAAKHYSKMNDNTASPVWWIFKKDNILVLISRKVPRDKAVQYEDALRNLGEK